MDKKDFISKHGGIFEHSAWIAERAVSAGDIPDQPDGERIHSAMCQQFRNASRDEKLGVLRAHPDLAGKLALAGKLTADSTAEQASAGLDQLSPEEHARFTELNTRYVDKFGFPFIIAVKGLTKEQILTAFEERINNSTDQEMMTACAQVEKIAKLRLNAMYQDN